MFAAITTDPKKWGVLYLTNKKASFEGEDLYLIDQPIQKHILRYGTIPFNLKNLTSKPPYIASSFLYLRRTKDKSLIKLRKC